MVQKFDLVSGYMQEWSEGEWVTYEDYAALQRQFEEYVDERTAELRALRKELALYKDNCQ
jgi:hypothetical protein